VDTIEEGSPAWKAGLNHDDLILAIGDVRVSSGNLQDRLDRAGPGPLEVTIFRGQRLRRLELTPQLRRLESWKIVPLEEVTDEQAAAYETWLGTPHPSRAEPG
jgi:predicted metalloprotease with PDZ domain